jgi:acetolactate synthase-1/2/3 large subunit
MSTTNGGELIARTLAAAGVRHAFGVHGGHLDSILTAMHSHGITLVDMRHEAAAGNAAEGYARASGGLGVAFATSGPGFANVFSALANAYVDRIPLLVLTSSPPLREVELNVLQGGVDQIVAAKSVTKWAHRVTTAARLPDLTALALRHALTGVPGPVMLEVPIDVAFKPVEESTATIPSLVLPARPAPGAEALEELIGLLRGAQRPVMVLGGGAALSPGVRPALESLVENVHLPVVTTSWGWGQLAPDHPCYLGGPAELGALPHLAGPPDLFLLLGARRGISLGARTERVISPDAKVVHVDIDGAEPGRLGNVTLAIQADVGEVIRALAARADSLPSWTEWTASAKAAKGAHAFLYADASEVSPTNGRLHPYFAAKAVMESIAEDSIVVYDGGETSGWINFFARAAKPRSWFGLGSMGGLGVGQGFSIGAQVARPDDRVVLVTGDGAVGFHLQEFDTMARHRLPVTTVVMNNRSWAMSLHGQQAIYGDNTRVAVDLPDTRYDVIAESMGLYGERVTDIKGIGPALDRARDSGLPACIDLAIDPDIVHPIMGSLTEPLAEGVTRIPYYEPIPLGEA